MTTASEQTDQRFKEQRVGARIAALGGEHRRVGWRAMDALVAAGGKSIQPLVPALENPEARLNEEDRRRMLSPGQRHKESSDDPPEKLRWGVQQVLSKIGFPAIGPLAGALATAAPASARSAAWALGWTGDQAALTPLLEALRHPEAGVRAGPAQALRHLRLSGAIKPLIAALADPAADVRCSAADVLGESGAQRAVMPSLQRWAIRQPWCGAGRPTFCDSPRRSRLPMRWWQCCPMMINVGSGSMPLSLLATCARTMPCSRH